MNNNIRNQETVCAVVVTYNRKNLLLECLEAIKKQTKPVDAIYLIDNASTDGTPELLMEKGYISELPPQELKELWEKEFEVNNLVDGRPIKLYYVRMHENTGGAGGFYEGMKRAYEKGYDWFWLMDDDGKPENNCLEILLSKVDIADFLAPVVLRIDKPDVLSFGLRKDIKTLEDCKLKSKDGILENVANPFNGVLLSRKLVNTIGFPKKEMFIWGDESEYLYRTLHFGLKVATIIDAKFYHPKGRVENVPIKWTRFSVLFSSNKLRNYCLIRNYAYIFYRYDIKALIKFFIKYTLFFLGNSDIKGLLFYLSATIDGILGVWGKERKYLNNSPR